MSAVNFKVLYDLKSPHREVMERAFNIIYKEYSYLVFYVSLKIVKDNDEFEWHGCDGDKIHASCKPNLDRAYDMFNNMNDNEFIKYIRGERGLLNP